MFKFEVLPFQELRTGATYITTNGSLFHCQYLSIRSSVPFFSGKLVAGGAVRPGEFYSPDGRSNRGLAELNIVGELKITPMSPRELQLAEIKSRSREEVYQELYERSSMLTSRGFDLLKDKEARAVLLNKCAEARKTFKQSLMEDKQCN